jgi:hypothetical protein
MFRTGGRAFLEQLGIHQPLRPLDLELASVKERRLDFLAELSPDRLLHIEFQSSRAASFVFRMLGYYGEILERVAAERRAGRAPLPLGLEIRQILIYLGQDRWRHADGLDHPNLKFRFETLNVSDVEAGPLVRTGDLGDAVLAILCRGGSSRPMIKAILDRIALAPEEQHSEALAQLLVLSKLRKVEAAVKEESANMPIIVNVEDIDLLRQPIDEAFAKGEARGLEKGEARGLTQALTLMLTAKFGALPKDVEERLAALRPIDVAALIERTASAVKLKDVLGESGHPRRRPKP